MAMGTNKVTSMENLVPQESFIKSKRTTVVLVVLLVLACVVAVIMTCLYAIQIDRTSTSQENSQKRSSLDNNHCPELPPILLPLPSPLPTNLREVLNRIDEYLGSLVNVDGLPAISANIFYQDSIIWAGHYGKKTLGGERPDNKTHYRIGSISKVFPVLMAYMLYEQGIVSSLDDPLNKYAPSFAINNPFTGENITLRQIANQLSGLPREAPCVTCMNNETTDEQLQILRKQSLVAEPGTVASYSNLGYALLGRLLAEKTLNTTFEAWTKENILSPLDLQNTGFDISQTVQENMAFSYDAQGNILPFMNIGFIAPSGQMYSTIEDLAHFGMFVVGAKKKEKLLKIRTLREILAPSSIAPDGQAIWSSPWETFLRENFLIRTKGGSIEMYSAMMTVIPEIQLGFNFILSSVSNFTSGALIANTILDRVYKDLLPIFNSTLFAEITTGKFPNSEMYCGNYNLTIADPYSPAEDAKYARATIIKKGLMLVFQSPRDTVFLFSMPLGEKLVLQGRQSAPHSCFQQRLGSLMAFYFKPPAKENGSSPGFEVPHLGVTAVRI